MELVLVVLTLDYLNPLLHRNEIWVSYTSLLISLFIELKLYPLPKVVKRRTVLFRCQTATK